MPHISARDVGRRLARRSSVRSTRRASRPGRVGAGIALTLGLTASLALAAQAQAAPASTAERATLSDPVRVATFNILGANHTENGSKGFATYETRMKRTIRLIERRQFGIVGFQEYQIPQHEMFLRRTDGAWGVYPGLQEGRRPVQNSIVWRKADWSIVEKKLYTIPYFGGRPVEQPYVKLRNDDGVEVWVINTHNPADSKGPAQRHRDEAMAIQADLANKLKRTGVPVILLGDFNERDEAYCYITGNSDLEAVNGGGWPNGRCDPPSWMRIDWIFASPSARVLNYVDLENANTRYITDHRVIFSDLSFPVS